VSGATEETPFGKRWSHNTKEEVDKLVEALNATRELFA
jgi:hypothetical protein